jgi:hypothetical protein
VTGIRLDQGPLPAMWPSDAKKAWRAYTALATAFQISNNTLTLKRAKRAYHVFMACFS